MASEWFYTVNGQQSPTSANDAQIKQMATAGQLQPTDMVWKDGMPNWVAANTIKGLFPASRPSGVESLAVEPVPMKKPDVRRMAKSDEDADAEPGGILGMHPILVFVLSICTGGIFAWSTPMSSVAPTVRGISATPTRPVVLWGNCATRSRSTSSRVSPSDSTIITGSTRRSRTARPSPAARTSTPASNSP